MTPEAGQPTPLLHVFCALFFLTCVPAAVNAQPYPSKPVRLVVGYPPGGSIDFLTRLVANKLGPALGQQVIVDNRGGAAGNIGATFVATAPPDGYTLLMVAATHAVNPSLFSSVGYDPVKDFVAITQITANDFVLVVHSSVPAKTLKEFIAFAKAKKGALTYASGGIGTAGHLGMELLKPMAGFEAIHVPYKGGGPAVTDLRAGLVDSYLATPPAVMQHLGGGQLRAIAGTGSKRSASLPNIPTIAEEGFPGYELSNWQGLIAPAGTPAAVVNRLYEEVSKILRLPDVLERINGYDANAVGSRPEEFNAYIKAEVARYAKVIKQSGAKAD